MMNKAMLNFDGRSKVASALALFFLCLQSPTVTAQGLLGSQVTRTLVKEGHAQPTLSGHRSEFKYDTYILGPGDGLEIELLDLPELSGLFSIGPDGTLYLPRLRALHVEGMTIEELRSFLSEQFSAYVHNPQVYVRPVIYRPIRIYVGGEVRRPGYYTLSGDIKLGLLEESKYRLPGLGENNRGGDGSCNGLSVLGAVFPTVFDAIRCAQGITPYTDLSKVQVIRKRPIGQGGGRIKTNLNFLSLITEGDESQNIRLFDGDSLEISKSPIVLRDQLLKAGQSNLTPQFMEVFVTGRVNIPGGIEIPQGSSLNQAISVAGGTKLLRGKIEFVRFNRDGAIDRKIFTYKPGAKADSPNNPILANGDLIRVNDSIIGKGVDLLNEVSQPFVGIYSIYSMFNLISQ